VVARLRWCITKQSHEREPPYPAMLGYLTPVQPLLDPGGIVHSEVLVLSSESEGR
jgi:hypothetical protein